MYRAHRWEGILNDPANEDCTVRVYLGRGRAAHRRPPVFSNLRNFPLHVDQVREWGLPAGQYARAMAEVLALVYWGAAVGWG